VIPWHSRASLWNASMVTRLIGGLISVYLFTIRSKGRGTENLPRRSPWSMFPKPSHDLRRPAILSNTGAADDWSSPFFVKLDQRVRAPSVLGEKLARV
jgi:hypothetical protein